MTAVTMIPDHLVAEKILHHLGGAEFLVMSNAYGFCYIPDGLEFRQHAVFTSVRNPNGIVRVTITQTGAGRYMLNLFTRRNKWAGWEMFMSFTDLHPDVLRPTYAKHACTALLESST